MWCANCNRTSYSNICEVCGGKTQQDTPIELFWCDSCHIPVIVEASDTGTHYCPICGKQIRYLAKDLRPVFPEERLLLEIIQNKPFAYKNASVWASGSRYYIDGKTSNLSIDLLKKLDANKISIELDKYRSQNSYIGKLPKNKVDAWKAVSNRFKSISISNDEAEIYDMIATVLNRDEEPFEHFVRLHQNRFDALTQIALKDSTFHSIQLSDPKGLVYRCYPLHPYSLLLLPRISELVAQNERTIFTFLSSMERYSVPYFLRTDDSEFPIIEPDYIYDYFEKLFKGEPYGSTIKKQWQITTAALAKLKEYDNELAEKIIKTIALIYCVNDFEIVPPSWDLICDIYSVNYSWAEIEAAKEILKKAHLLIELLYKPYVRISEGSRHDVLELIQQEVYKLEKTIKTSAAFNEYCKFDYGF